MIFIKTLNNSRKIGLAVIATFIVFLYSYLVPGWDYLGSIWGELVDRSGIGFILLVLFIFYFFHVIILYQVLLYIFSEKVSINHINNDSVEVTYKKRNHVVSGSALEMDQNTIKLNLEGEHFTISRSLLKSNTQEYNILLNRLKENTGVVNTSGDLFVNSFFIKNPKLQFLVFAVLGFAVMFLFRILIEPYKAEIGLITRTRNAFLEIIVTLPFLFLYLFLVYTYFSYTAKIKKIAFTAETLKFEGNKIIPLPKKSIQEIHIIENSVYNRAIRILFYTHDKNLYSLNFITPDIVDHIKKYFKLEQFSSEITAGTKKEEVKKIFKL
ncbi:hypothetical protein IQ37_13305 [Chryseobacterium piperi]|uniref:Uncharacterized protein n=1 Tax=Chryseobacterium piperi TaxID=558152 RepID=A0A086B612_9FLAO|nr:hypothetical protein [Chryseobacterium piperi]ASW74477.2 hypothetical protein CJF12_09410 [Chryseobacterium piperi]KFF24376.1 hypothetical protein IQ37_13305 [Chryseobacterium piperi]